MGNLSKGVAGGVAACLAWGLAACGGSAQKTSAPPTSAAASASKAPSRPSLYQQAKKEGTVVWDNASASNQMQPVIQAFEKTYPGVTVQYAVVKPLQQVTNAQTQEAAHHVTFDVGEAAQLDIGRLYTAHLVSTIPSSLGIDPSKILAGEFVGYGSIPTVVIYNKKLVPPSEVPKTWSDLLNPRWKGKLALDARGTFLGMYFENSQLGGQTAAVAYAKQILAQKPYLEGDLAAIEPMVVSGQVLIGTDALTEAVFNIQKGAPIAIAPVSPIDNGINYLYIPPGDPHPAAAQLLVRWLASPAGQAELNATDNGLLVSCSSPDLAHNAMSKALCTEHIQPYAFNTLSAYEKAPAFFTAVQTALGTHAGK